MAILAFDRSERFKDQDGRLHVRVCNISKATVNGYRGAEIPNADTMGLDPDRIYQLLRPAEELARAAESFNNIPLMSRHVAVSADDPREKDVAGSTGTDAAFVAPYLQNSLVIWRAEDIADVESRDKCQLSCAYRYVAVMEPGTYQGLRYDGVMRNIQANHVALVEAGRAGPDVMVHDSKENLMPRLTRKSILSKLGMAADASLDDLHAFIDRMDKDGGGGEDEDLDAMDESERAEEVSAREKDAKDGMSPEDCDKAKDARRGARDAKRAKDAAGVVKDKKAKDAFPEKDKDDEDFKKETAADKRAKDQAMDSALARVRSETETAVIARMNAIAQAREDVRPIIGSVSFAMDSAAGIYKLALDHLKIDTRDVPPAAYGAVLKAVPRAAPKRQPIAMDESFASLETRFPGLGRITNS